MSERIFANKYEVQQEIAQGAMGIVYKALDLKLNRVVALKVVHPHLTNDASFLQRFLREARAMARLQHNNIVTIYSVEQDQGTQFMVMEYFPGTNLHSRIQLNTGLPLSQALAITSQIANALAYAHAHGIIHRDIKPANALIGTADHVKLTDFGIAAALDEAPLTTAGQLIGTLLYMSPEQAKDAGLDGRSDLYSLGLMLYEMLTGSHPRRGLSNAAVLGMLASEAASPTLSFSSDIPPNVQGIVRDLLRYRPTDRIKDAQQLLDRLEELTATGRPIPRLTPQLNTIADDRTICELDVQTPPLDLSPTRGQRRPPVKEPSDKRASGSVVAIAFGIIATLTLGYVGLNSFLSAPQPVVSQRGPEPRLAPKEVQELLERLRQSVATKDLAEIDKISVMSEDRRTWLESLFQNYSTIEASVAEIDANPTMVSAILRIDKLVLPNGESFPVGSSLQKIQLTVPHEDMGWGTIQW